MYRAQRCVVFPLVCIALLVLLVGCGNDSSDDTGDTGGEGAGLEVELSHTYFAPSELSVSAGDTVVFRNLEAMSHPLLSQEAGLDTGAFSKGQRSFTFDQPGSYVITNTAHGTTMTIVVQ